MITSSISVSFNPGALFRASLTTMAPSFGAGKSLSVLPNFPIGVLTALTMTGVFSGDSFKMHDSYKTKYPKSTTRDSVKNTLS